MMNRSLKFDHILTPDGIVDHQRLEIDGEGHIAAITAAAPSDPSDGWLALPGMPNSHSHAFQRAMVGYGEKATGKDSFWSWREAMYRLASGITPEDYRAIAAQAFSDMLHAGYTTAGEFHYLHHRPDGSPGPEMVDALIEAARETGIRLVVLPVLYQTGGFKKPAGEEHRRFVHENVDDYLRVVESLDGVPRGIAPHSLRAVPPENLPHLIGGATQLLGPQFPIHMHAAEQQFEVVECQAYHGEGPIGVIGREVEFDDNWSIIHATHGDEVELEELAKARATVVLCPLTEAYLGDGLFPARRYSKMGGRIAIGSDSNVRIDVASELRLLEYGQRLRHARRARLANEQGLGAPLWSRVAAEGGHSLQQPIGVLEAGACADIVVLDPDHQLMLGTNDPKTALDALVTGGDRTCIKAVYVGGELRVSHGAMHGEADIRARFSRHALRLMAD